MDVSTLLIVVAVLACPIGMGLMMWQMNKKMGGESHASMSGADADRLKVLREQRQTLDQEIAEMQKIVELEGQKRALTGTAASESSAHSQNQSG